MTQGQTVYVQWYGNIVEGTVVENTTPDDPLLGCMVAVSIPIQGTIATALFMPAHVYDTPDAQKHTVCENKQPVYKREEPVCENEQYASEDKPSPPLCPTASPSEKSSAARLQRFKQDHWDHKHNHLNVEALDEYYALWREAHGSHRQEEAAHPAPQPSPRYIVGLDLAADTEPPQPQHSLPVQSAAVSQQPKPQKRIVATQLPLLFE